MVRTHSVMVWAHYPAKKSLLGGEWVVVINPAPQFLRGAQISKSGFSHYTALVVGAVFSTVAIVNRVCLSVIL